ncbi:MAG: hypothetical protein LBV23_08330 [Deltaproteobacteria bacterium]|jgi:hypothetical protein|nr:hypothetical protein [Deltaproteobacteria bacterium]
MKLFTEWLAKFPKEFVSDDYTTDYEQSHGQLKKGPFAWLRSTISNIYDWLPAAIGWKGLATLAEVTRESTETKAKAQKR